MEMKLPLELQRREAEYIPNNRYDVEWVEWMGEREAERRWKREVKGTEMRSPSAGTVPPSSLCILLPQKVLKS